MRRKNIIGLPLLALALPALFLASAPAAAEDVEGAYGYFRTVEGSALVRGLDETYDAEENRPLLTGDVLQTRFGSRVEVVLPDSTRVRVGSDAEIAFDQLAFAADRWSDTTILALRHGEAVVTVPEERRIDSSLRVDAPNATIYLDEPGSYTLEARGYVTQIVVRQGFAEALTREGTYRLRAGEHAWIEGTEWPQVEIGRAGSRDDLERWAYDLDLEAARYASRGHRYVDGSLAYSASRLDGYGTWYDDGGRAYWRPSRVSTSWRPYDDGYWTHTPSGLTWVSYEPWGWATYHYGTWDFHSRYGWVWYPGTRYAPAWVYWYWGPRYVGWCPTGYYTRYYDRPYYWGWGGGVYGWAGGHRDNWNRWNFVDVDRFGDRRLARHTRPGAHLDAVQDHLDRGILTTDTSVLDRDAIRQPRTAVRVLENAKRTRSGGDLPDLTDFVARKKDLPENVRNIAMPTREAGERPSAPRTISVTPRPRDGGEPGARDSDTRRIRSATPTQVRQVPTRPSTDSTPRSDTSSPRTRVVSPRDRDQDPDRSSRSVIRARPSEEVRSTPPNSGDWRQRASEPRSRSGNERPQVYERPENRSPSPARRVIEGVRSDRHDSPPAGARPVESPRSRPTATPPPARTTTERPDRSSPRASSPRSVSRPSSVGSTPRATAPRSSTRSTSSRPSSRERATTSSSRPDRSSVRQRSSSSSRSGSSSVRQRSTSSSRPQATRSNRGSSSRGSRATAQRSRGSSDPDR